jgi:cysteine desulfurase
MMSGEAFDSANVMTGKRVYLDWNATSPLRPQARDAFLAALEGAGNPSSVHAEGREARARVEAARREVAALVSAEARNVVFTSGATEANMMALSPHLRDERDSRRPCRLLVSAVEHPSVRVGGRFAGEAIDVLRVTAEGTVDLEGLAAALRTRDGERVLVSIMAANNETGVVQPVREAAEIVHAAGGILHVDAVQAAGRIPLDINALEADLLTLSGHKMGAPQGVGALVRRSQSLRLSPLIAGGGQERGQRAGTENVAAIAGFGAAAAAARMQREPEAARLAGLRERLERGLCEIATDTVIFGRSVDRLANTTLFAVPGVAAESALMALDLAGVAASSGAACSSGKVAPSHVLAAMGVALPLAAGAIRVSTGWASGERDVEVILQAWRKCVAALGKGRARQAA